MNKVVSDRYQECYYEETLPNGLKVVVWHKPGYEKSFAMMSTPMGAFDISQIDSKGNTYQYPPGIAHFLEHKLFENENRDVMEDFSKMGASVNAATTYDLTTYYFQTSTDLYEPLNILLDFTQSLDITKESVEKEKGIINQELSMYDQMSDFKLVKETFAALFHDHPMKYDIGGTTDSVNNTTLEQLEACYKYNYHPSTMICMIVTGKEPQEVLKAVRENQSKKRFPSINSIHRRKCREQQEIVKKHVQFEMDVTTPKVNIAFKLNGIKNQIERNKMEIGIRYLMDSIFTTMNEDYQEWLDKEIINDFFGYECDFGEDYGYLMIYTETNKIDEFKDMIFTNLNKMMNESYKQETFNQLKKRYFGENIKELNDFEAISFAFIRNYFNKTNFFDVLEIIDSFGMNDIEKIKKSLNFDHYSVIECLPMK